VLGRSGLDYQKILENNYRFLSSTSVEYIVYDALPDYKVLEFIKKYPKIRYVRKSFLNTRACMLETGLLSSGEKLIYLKSADIVTPENVTELETIRPNILRKDLKKIASIKRENFSYDNFNLLIKENKSIWEKLKLLF
jgi:hypothetical protein